MKTLSDAIGEKCVYCHDEKNYPSDEKPAKDFARHKLQMVDWLNVKYRPAGAKWEYGCYSCHRGQIRPVPWVPPVRK
jgi:hypothetical protein